MSTLNVQMIICLDRSDGYLEFVE